MTDLPGGPVGQTSGSGQWQGRGHPRGRPSRGGQRSHENGVEERDAGSPNDRLCWCWGECKCDCGGDNCGLTEANGTIRRLLQELEGELAKQPLVAGAPNDARTELDKALQDAEKEYLALDDVVKKYREYHCQIECDLERARTWCEDLRSWCPASDEGKIRELWYGSYEWRERAMRCDWIASYERLNATRDCLEQARIRVEFAKADYEAVKNFEKTLRERFAELKTLYDRARGFLDAKEPRAVCAILLEYRKVYERLGRLVDMILSGYWPMQCRDARGPWMRRVGRPCRPPDHGVRDFNAAKLRERLIDSLRGLLVAQYCRFCWYQQRIENTADRDRRRAELDAFLKRRRDDFILEARDVPDTAGAMGAGADAGDEGSRRGEYAEGEAGSWDDASGEEDEVSWEITGHPPGAAGEDGPYAEDEPYTEQP